MGEWLIVKGINVIRTKKHGLPERSIFKLGLVYLTRAVSTAFGHYTHLAFKVLSGT